MVKSVSQRIISSKSSSAACNFVIPIIPPGVLCHILTKPERTGKMTMEVRKAIAWVTP